MTNPAGLLKCVPAVDPGPVLDEVGHDGRPAVVAGQVQSRLAFVVPGSQVPAGKGFTVSASYLQSDSHRSASDFRRKAVPYPNVASTFSSTNSNGKTNNEHKIEEKNKLKMSPELQYWLGL